MRNVKRGLKNRYVSMIALGGCIGTGLFVASGNAISQAGPGGGLLAYVLMGIMVYFLMTSLGEMATNWPTSGSFAEYGSKYIDPAAGFALGWNYWFNWAITVAVDVSTVAIVMKFWWPHTPSWIWSGAALLLILLINAISVKAFGSTEYWLSLIKIIVVIAFLVVGLLTIIGVMGGSHAVGLSNFTYRKAPFVGGIPAIISVFVVAGFSFQGTELVGITAGESADPDHAVPEAIRKTFWRILLFYILSIAVIAALIPYTSHALLGSGASDVTTSPFTLVFKRAGLAAAASFMNAIILVAVLSAANSGMYASTRVMYAMGRHGYAPKFLGRVNRRGIPYWSLIVTILVSLAAFVSSFAGPKVYVWLVAASGLTGFIAWLGIAIAHLRFRKGFVKQGHRLSELHYHAKWFPLGPIMAIILCLIVICGQDVTAFADLNWYKIGITYISVPLVLILYVGYKLIKHTRLVPLDKMDVRSLQQAKRDAKR